MKVKVGFLVKELEGLGIYNPENDFREATVSSWHKKAGDRVTKGECLAEIETDKVTQDFLSPIDGILLSLNYEAGEKWEYGGVEETPHGEILLPELCIIETGNPQESESEGQPRDASSEGTALGEDIRITPIARRMMEGCGISAKEIHTAFPDETKIDKRLVERLIAERSQEPTDESKKNVIPAIPAARHLAREKGVDLSRLAGSGDNGLILLSDVEGYLENALAQRDTPSSEEMDDRVLLGASQLRKTIARFMMRSHEEIPAAGDSIEVKASILVRFREERKRSFELITGAKLRYDYIFAFIAMKHLALDAFRIINGYWDKDIEDGYIFRHVNMGIAVNMKPTDKDPFGALLVPVIKGADTMSFAEFAIAAEEKVLKAQSGRASLPDLWDLTFTVNNVGGFGGENADSAIPYTRETGGRERPTAFILVIGAIKYREGNQYLNLSFRFDHRLFDGNPAGPFVAAIRDYIESKSKPEDFEELFDPSFSFNQ